MGRVYIHRLADVEVGCSIGDGTKIWRWTHIREGATIGSNCSIGQGCYMAATSIIGNNVRVQNGVYIWDGVVIEDDVFIGPNVCFTNVKRPRAYKRGRFEKTVIKKGAAIGANATIVCGTTIGENAFVGAGSVVTKDVPDQTIAWGVPARVQNYAWLRRDLQKLDFERDLEQAKTKSFRDELHER